MLYYSQKGVKDMNWRACTFLEAVKGMLGEFDRQPSKQSLALVWRSGGEYNVMDNWLLEHVMISMDEKTLRIVLWLTREEAAKLISIIKDVE